MADAKMQLACMPNLTARRIRNGLKRNIPDPIDFCAALTAYARGDADWYQLPFDNDFWPTVQTLHGAGYLTSDLLQFCIEFKNEYEHQRVFNCCDDYDY